jgi:threonine dehydratase
MQRLFLSRNSETQRTRVDCYSKQHMSLFAEGASCPMVGEETFRVCNELVDDMVVVTNDEICAAIEVHALSVRQRCHVVSSACLAAVWGADDR